MDLNKFTEKAQQAVLQAQSLAEEGNHSQVEAEHLLAALLAQEGGVVPQLIGKLGVPAASLAAEIQQILSDKPKVYGAAARVSLSPALGQVLRQAESEAKQMRDEYVSTEHLLLALTS